MFGLATFEWTLTEETGATGVSVDETMQDLLASLFKESFNQNLANGMQHWLNLLKTQLEK